MSVIYLEGVRKVSGMYIEVIRKVSGKRLCVRCVEDVCKVSGRSQKLFHILNFCGAEQHQYAALCICFLFICLNKF